MVPTDVDGLTRLMGGALQEAPEAARRGLDGHALSAQPRGSRMGGDIPKHSHHRREGRAWPMPSTHWSHPEMTQSGGIGQGRMGRSAALPTRRRQVDVGGMPRPSVRRVSKRSKPKCPGSRAARTFAAWRHRPAA